MSFICVFACFKDSLSDVSINCIIFLFFWHLYLFTKLLFNKILPCFTLDNFSVLLKIISNTEIRISDKRISKMRYMLFYYVQDAQDEYLLFGGAKYSRDLIDLRHDWVTMGVL